MKEKGKGEKERKKKVKKRIKKIIKWGRLSSGEDYQVGRLSGGEDYQVGNKFFLKRKLNPQSFYSCRKFYFISNKYGTRMYQFFLQVSPLVFPFSSITKAVGTVNESFGISYQVTTKYKIKSKEVKKCKNST